MLSTARTCFEKSDIFGLRDFSQGALDLLVGAAALSVVIGLIATALEDLARPYFQRRHFKRWLFGYLSRDDDFRRLKTRASEEPAPSPSFRDFLIERLEWLPRPFFALPPDQLCAQIIRRLQSNDAELDSSPRKRLSDERGDEWSRWGEQGENAVDELQVRLDHSARARSYGFAGSIATAFGLLMYALERPNFEAPGLALARVAVLTAVFGGVAVLLSPIIQSMIGRFLRPR